VGLEEPKETRMKVAMISYNTFVDGESNGWKNQGDNSVLLLQNEDGSGWGVDQNATNSAQLQAGADDCVGKVNGLWGQLVEVLPTIDKVVFYVGSYGAERAIELAAEHGLTPDKAIFVCCHCNLNVKMRVIRDRGFSSSVIVDCECGGYNTMRLLYNNVLIGAGLPN